MNDTKKTTGGVEHVAGLKHHIFQINGGPISVYEAGDIKAPKVVMLHGAMFDEARFIWDQMFPYLSQAYHVFAIDTPRHGKSRPWDGNMDHTRLMDILHATFKRLNLTSINMVGLSMGGGLCIEYASLYPDIVTSMALFEPGGLGETVDKQFITWLYIKTPGMLSLVSKKYVKANQEDIQKLLESIYVCGTKPTDPHRLMSILREEIKGKCDYKESDMDDWQINIISPFRLKWNLLDRIPLLKCPTLWLRGADSTLVKQDEMEKAVKLVQNSGAISTLKVIQNAGHLLPLEQPKQANEVVKLFLDSL